MAVTVSGLYLVTFRDVFDPSNVGINLDAETHKGALFSNAITPNFNTDSAYGVAPYNANEVISAGPWPTGGVALVGTLIDITTISGTLIFDATDVSVAATTLTNARSYLLYADAETTPTVDPAILLVDFDADFSTVNGTFGVQWAAPAAGGTAALGVAVVRTKLARAMSSGCSPAGTGMAFDVPRVLTPAVEEDRYATGIGHLPSCRRGARTQVEPWPGSSPP